LALKQEILLNITPQETRVALLENGVLLELQIERSLSRGLVGNIYHGKVVRVLPGMQAAFVDIGLSKNGFLHAADIVRVDDAFKTKGTGKVAVPPIQDLVREGQSIWVQVIKDPIGNKGARLTTELTLPSRYLVMMPFADDLGISQKISDQDERQRLQEIASTFRDTINEDLQASEKAPSNYGWIIRTAGEGIDSQELQNDFHYLYRLWRKLQERMSATPAKSLLHQDIPLAMRVLRDLIHDDVELIRIDSKETYDKAVEFAAEFIPELSEKIHYYPGSQPLFGLYNVEQDLQLALQKRVDLKSGGYLIIDQTEAMTTIDVNTGSYVGKRNQEDTLYKTNLEAATQIARQIRLRNLAGIIIIDFIDMLKDSHKSQVLEALKSALMPDRVKTRVTDMSPLGLVEITRKRTRDSLETLLCEPCPVCDGRGKVKTVKTVCYEILREVVREYRQFKAEGYRIIASQAVVDQFLDEEADSLADLQEFIQRPVSLLPEDSYLQEEYDIVLT
jgi:ribonuclease G